MRIAYISHEYPLDTGKGGIGTYTYQMAQIMKNRGHEVEVFCGSYERNVSEVYDEVKTHRIKMSSKEDFRLRVVEIFKQIHNANPFDLVECPEIGAEGSFIKINFPELPLVVRFHTPAVLVTRLQNTYTPFSIKVRFILGNLLRGRIDLGFWSKHDKNQLKDPDFLITEQANALTSPSLHMKNWAHKFWKIDQKRILVVPNPFVPNPALLEIERKGDKKRITFLGRLNVLKGIIPLTESLKSVLRLNPDWKMRFIGKSEQSHITGLTMQQFIQQELSEFADQLEFFDWISTDEIPEHLSETEILVIPSLFESFSYVCAEGMSAACAIVGSKTSAINELLEDKKSGLLVNPKNSGKISSALLYLISHKEQRLEMGAAARTRVKELYNEKLIGHKMETLYQTLLNE
jgi:glycogen(starch) synthase